MPLLYLPRQLINVDSRDSQDHFFDVGTYQGDAFSFSFDLLLRHGTNPNLKGDAGLTSLCWAVVKGNRVAIRRLGEKTELHATWLQSLKVWAPGNVLLKVAWMNTVSSEENHRAMCVFSSPTAVNLLLILTTPAKHKNRNFHHAHYLLSSHVHDLDDFAMVYRHLSRISRDVPCTSFLYLPTRYLIFRTRL